MAERSRGFAASSRVRLGLASDQWLVACVRRGDTAAFETLYDRHARELLGFCVYMLGSRHDAEDAVQATFASAYRALRADSRPVALRPWLFTIARNECVSILRRRRPVVELNGEVAPGADPAEQIELRDEVRRVFAGLRELPESQRAALVLAEVHGLSHNEVGEVLGVRAHQVKSFVFQARSKLISERAARDTDCTEIREQLATARGAALLRGQLRRHVRSCADCKLYADGVARQRRQLGALLPIVPSLALKYRAIEEALNVGASDPVTLAGGATVAGTAAGTAAELAGGGLNAIVCKVAVGVACLGASAGVGVSVLNAPSSSAGGSATSASASTAALVASASTAGSPPWTSTAPAFEHVTAGGERFVTGNPRTDAGSGALPEVQNGVTVHEEASVGGGAGGNGGGGAGRSHGDGSSGQLPEGGSGSGGAGSQAGEPSAESERRVAAEELRLQREAHKRLSEERRKAREEPKPEGGSRAPRSEEEIARKREEAKREREERKPEGHSRAPRTEEEMRIKREKRDRVRAEKRKRREEEERAKAQEAEAPAP